MEFSAEKVQTRDVASNLLSFSMDCSKLNIRRSDTKYSFFFARKIVQTCLVVFGSGLSRKEKKRNKPCLPVETPACYRPNLRCVVGRDTFLQLAPALGSQTKKSDVTLFRCSCMIPNMSRSSRCCCRHSWGRAFPFFS